MYKYASNMNQICKKYAENMPLHRLQHSKHANYMQKYAKKMQLICRLCIRHILRIYALPTLLMLQESYPCISQNRFSIPTTGMPIWQGVAFPDGLTRMAAAGNPGGPGPPECCPGSHARAANLATDDCLSDLHGGTVTQAGSPSAARGIRPSRDGNFSSPRYQTCLIMVSGRDPNPHCDSLSKM